MAQSLSFSRCPWVSRWGNGYMTVAPNGYLGQAFAYKARPPQPDIVCCLPPFSELLGFNKICSFLICLQGPICPICFQSQNSLHYLQLPHGELAAPMNDEGGYKYRATPIETTMAPYRMALPFPFYACQVEEAVSFWLILLVYILK